jgi:hypothetical protein
MFMNDLDDKWETDEDGHFIRTERDGEDLIKSSREGCYICQKVYENQFGRWPTLLPTFDCHTDNHAILTPATKQQPWFHLEVCSDVRGSDFGPYTEARFVIQEADEIVHELGNKALGSDYTGSEEVLRLASHWLSTCLKTNKTCDSHLEPKWYPTRLLQLFEDHIRLIFTSKHHPSGPYATLSHRWGSKPFESLTAENITRCPPGCVSAIGNRRFCVRKWAQVRPAQMRQLCMAAVVPTTD